MGMQTFDRILVAVDGSKNSLEACSAASMLAGPEGAPVEIVRVIRGDGDGEARAEADRTLVRARALASRGWASTVGRVIEGRGPVIETLANYVSEKRFDLLVLGAEEPSGLRRLLRRSASSDLVTHARTSVLVVRNLSSAEGRPFESIMVAVDGSEESMCAVRTAAALAKSMGARLTILHVVLFPGEAYSSGCPKTISAEREARERAEGYVSLAREAAEEFGVNSRVQIIEDLESTVWGITDCASENAVDLIVTGTRGLDGFKRLLGQSVSSGVVTRAPCSVLVVRNVGQLLAKAEAREEAEEEQIVATVSVGARKGEVRSNLASAEAADSSPGAQPTTQQGTA